MLVWSSVILILESKLFYNVCVFVFVVRVFAFGFERVGEEERGFMYLVVGI